MEIMTDSLSLMAPAKLNLMLHIIGQRADGYHNLQTAFQILDYGDMLHFTLRHDAEINIIGDFPGVPMHSNIIFKAAQALQPLAKKPSGIDIAVDKCLPMGGGLGGGSSNAATTLLALNQLWQCDCDNDTLAEIGLSLGADVPVFVRGRTAWAEGIGEQLTPIDLPEQWFVVLKPDVEVSTAEIFQHGQLTRNTSAITVAAFLKTGGRNDCENVVRMLYPAVDDALKWLAERTDNRAMLTGTGACIFASCTDKEQATDIFMSRPKNLRGFIAKGVNFSPACV
jgi:4-diphosphocytidyl-2-C-methyl-D-erythritol kinase